MFAGHVMTAADRPFADELSWTKGSPRPSPQLDVS